jgi:hypothetical protein
MPGAHADVEGADRKPKPVLDRGLGAAEGDPASSLSQRREHREGDPAPNRISPGGAELSQGRFPLGILPRLRLGNPPVEEPVHRASAGLGDSRERLTLRYPATPFVRDQRVPRDARLTGEGGLGQAKAVAEQDDPAANVRGDARCHVSVAQYGTAGAHRRSGVGVCSGSQIGTSCHQPPLTRTGRYSVEQPHQSGMSRVPGRPKPSRRSRSRPQDRVGGSPGRGSASARPRDRRSSTLAEV